MVALEITCTEAGLLLQAPEGAMILTCLHTGKMNCVKKLS